MGLDGNGMGRVLTLNLLVKGASKATVKFLSEGLNAELLDTNVAVKVVFPGAIGPNIAANSCIDQHAMQ